MCLPCYAELGVICVNVVGHIIIFCNLSQWEHVDVE